MIIGKVSAKKTRRVIKIAWKYFRLSKPKRSRSLSQLKREVDKLKKAEKNVKSYYGLQEEKQRIMGDIRREGFKARHEKALKIISGAENTAKRIGIGLGKATIKGAKIARPYAHRYLSKKRSKLAKYI